MKNQNRNLIEEAIHYAMNFYSIQEHELVHEISFFKDFLKKVETDISAHDEPGVETDIYLILPKLNNTEKKLVLVAERYLQEKAGE